MNKYDKIWIKSMDLCKEYCSCHQLPERSFFIKGYQFPLCARCSGIAIGHICAFLIAPFRDFKFIIGILMIPLIADGLLQYLTSYESNNKKRLISGILYGFSFTSIVFHLIRIGLKKII